MKKISLLFANCLLLSASVFAQNEKKVKDFLTYEPHIVVKKTGVYSLIKLQSFKVTQNKVQIKGTIVSTFELQNLMPANIVTQSILVNEEVSITNIWVSQNGGLDKQSNRIWIAINLSNLAGIDEYLEDDSTFDYPQF